MISSRRRSEPTTTTPDDVVAPAIYAISELGEVDEGVDDVALVNASDERIMFLTRRGSGWIQNGTALYTRVPDSPRGVADGGGADVNTITLQAGHGLADGDFVSIKSGGVFVALHRELSAVGATSATVSGGAVTYDDGAELIKEGVPDLLAGWISVQSGGVVLFDAGLVTALARTRLGQDAQVPVSTKQLLQVHARVRPLLNGSPAASAYYGVGWEHATQGSRFGVVNMNNAGTWNTGVISAVSTITSVGHATGAPTHDDARDVVLSMTRSGTSNNSYAGNVQGPNVNTGAGIATTTTDASGSSSNVLPFFAEARDGSSETLAMRIDWMRMHWET